MVVVMVFFVVVVGGLACNKTIGDQREQREKEKQNVVMVNKKKLVNIIYNFF